MLYPSRIVPALPASADPAANAGVYWTCDAQLKSCDGPKPLAPVRQ